MSSKITIAVTGAAGIAYSLLPRLGELDHPDSTIKLQLLEIEPAMGKLEGVVMELEDCAYPFIESISYTSSEEGLLTAPTSLS